MAVILLRLLQDGHAWIYLLLLLEERMNHRQKRSCPLRADRLQKWQSCHCQTARWHSCVEVKWKHFIIVMELPLPAHDSNSIRYLHSV